MEFTKPRSKNTLAKELRRLKKGSVPSKMLNAKRKEISQNEKKTKITKRLK